MKTQPLASIHRLSVIFRNSAFIIPLALAPLAHADSYTWIQNAAGTQTWADAGNWSPSQFVDGTANELVFFSDTTTALTNGTNFITAGLPTTGTMNILTLNGKGAAATGPTSIVIGTNASTWTLGGTTPTVNLNGVNGTQALNYTIAPNLVLTAATAFQGAGTAGFNFTGNISGSGALAKTGANTLTLSGNNSFTGGITTGNAGTLVLKTSNAAGTGQITYAFSTLKLDNAGTGQNIWLPNALSTNGSVLVNVAGDNRMNGSFNLNSGSSHSYLEADGGSLELAGGYGAGTTGRFAHLQGTGYGLFSGNITFGTNTLDKTQTGTWQISGANTYNGATTVGQGTLIARSVNAFGSSPVTVSANANLSYVATTDTTLNLSQTLAITGGANTVIGASIGSTGTSAEIKVTGAATTTAANVKVNVFGINGVTPLAGTNTYTLVHSNTSTSTLNSGTYALGMVYNNTNFTVGAPTATTTDLQVAITSTTALTTAFWKGGLTGGTNVWAASNGSTQSNWTATSGGADQALVPGVGADVTISNSPVTTAPTSTYLGADMTIKSLTIADTTNGLGLGNDFFTLTISPTVSSAGITVNNSVPASTINSRVKLGTAQTWTNDSSNPLTVSGIVSGTGSLTKSGTGALILSGWNTYTGNTSVNQGTLRLSNQIAAQSSTVVMNGGALEFDQSVTGNAFTFGGLAASSSGAGYDIALQNNAGTPAAIALTVGGNNANTTYAGVLSGSGSLTKAGSGTLTLSALNTYSGGTTLNAGTVSIASDSNLGASTSPLTFNGGGLQVTGTTVSGFGTHPVTFVAGKSITLDINNASNNFNTGTTPFIAGQTLTKLGAGTLTLAATSNALTTLNINASSIVDIGAGTLTVANAGASTIQSTTGGTINATGGGSIVLGANSDDVGTAAGTTLTINAPITGIAGNQFEIYNGGAGTVVLTATNTFAGNVLVSTGILSVAKIGNQGSTTSALGSGTTVTLGNVTTTGQLKYTGTGETTDRIVNVNNGASNVAIDQSGSGLLKFTGEVSGTTGGNGTKTLTLQGSTAGTGEISGAIGNGSAGTQAITKAGTGTWTLSGTNTYAGKTTVNGGSLQFAKPSALYTGSTGSWIKANIIVNNTGTLAFNVGGPNDFTSADFTTLLGNLTGDVSTGGFKAGSAIGLNTANATGDVTIADVLANTTGAGGGAFGFTKSGAGTAIITGSNTHTGNTTVNQGTLRLSNQFAAQSSTVVMNGGALEFDQSVTGNAFTFGGLGGSSDLALQNNAVSPAAIALTVGANTSTYSGNLSGSGSSLIKSGIGALTLSGSNSFTGGVTVSGGALILGNPGALNSVSPNNVTVTSGTFALNGNSITVPTLNVTGGAFIQNGASSDATLTMNGGNITGFRDGSTGKLAVVVTSSVNLNASNTFTGGLWIKNGFMDLGAGSSFGNGTVTLGDTSGAAANVLLGGHTSATWSNSIVVESGNPGTVTLNNFGGYSPTLSGPINLKKTFNVYNNSGNAASKNITLSGMISGSSGLYLYASRNSDLNQITLSNTTSDFTGSVTINSGVVYVAGIANGGSASSLGASTSDPGNLIFDGGTLKYTGTGTTSDRAFTINAGKTATIETANDLSFAGATGAATNGALTKTGAGTLTITGTQTYTGLTSVNNGTLAFDVSETLTGGLNVATSGTAVLTAHTGGAGNVKVLDITGLTISGTTAFVGDGGKDLGGLASPAPVPEPGTIGLLAVGAIAGLLLRSRSRNSGN